MSVCLFVPLSFCPFVLCIDTTSFRCAARVPAAKMTSKPDKPEGKDLLGLDPFDKRSTVQVEDCRKARTGGKRKNWRSCKFRQSVEDTRKGRHVYIITKGCSKQHKSEAQKSPR